MARHRIHSLSPGGRPSARARRSWPRSPSRVAASSPLSDLLIQTRIRLRERSCSRANPLRVAPAAYSCTICFLNERLWMR